MTARPRLDPVVHQRVRLGIMGLLNAADNVDFAYIREELDLTDSNLSQHLSTLEDAGYIEIKKRFVRKRPRTAVGLTSEGRRALATYIADLKAIVGSDTLEVAEP